MQLLRREQRKEETTHVSFADLRMIVLWAACASKYPCLLLPFARLLPKRCSNFPSELHVYVVSDPFVLKIWAFK